ncbi:MAG: DUF1524 domain-containing protein [Rhodobacteraceae bacterium]|nr:DUF1524 domain-containing protein [Paracoccaceae bacterium]
MSPPKPEQSVGQGVYQSILISAPRGDRHLPAGVSVYPARMEVDLGRACSGQSSPKSDVRYRNVGLWVNGNPGHPSDSYPKGQKYARKDDPKPRMVEAYFFFFAALKDFFVGTAAEDLVGGNHSIEMRLEECLRSMRSSLLVVVIDLDAGDDPQVIFETLNARGQPLLPADLIRNYIFLRARRDELDTEKMYEKYWRHFDDEFWRDEVRQGRLNRPRSDIFVQHLLASRQGRDIPIKHLYAEYRHWSEKEETKLSVLEELKLISEQSQNFRRLLAPETDDPIAPLATFLSVFDVSTIYPLLLSFFEIEPSDEEWGQIGEVLESYIVRRAICDLGTKNYNKLFLSAARNLRREGFTAQNLAQFLKSQSGESGLWPDDNLFLEGWVNNEVYRPLGSGRLVHILSKLNQKFGSTKSETLKFEVRPTVEHIMPQNWQKHWPLQSGEKGMTFYEMQDVDQTDQALIDTRERNRVVQRMGNLTILSQALNSDESNLGWSEKKPKLMAHSLLPLNLQLHDQMEWNEETVSKRGVELFGHALEIWQR